MTHKRIPDRVTMMELREQPGEVLRAVDYDQRTIIVTKNGHDIAKIEPIERRDIIHPDGTVEGEPPLTKGLNLGGGY